MPDLVEDDEVDINFLLSQSLITISTLPFHLVNDLWRWKIFAGEGIHRLIDHFYLSFKNDHIGRCTGL